MRYFDHVMGKNESEVNDSVYGNKCSRKERKMKAEKEMDKQNREQHKICNWYELRSEPYGRVRQI